MQKVSSEIVRPPQQQVLHTIYVPLVVAIKLLASFLQKGIRQIRSTDEDEALEARAPPRVRWP